MFENRIGFMASLGFTRMKPATIVGQLRRLGYSAISWTPAHFNPRKHSIEELRELVDLSRQGGLDVSEVVVQQDYVCLDDEIREERVRRTIQTIGVCADVGVRTVNLFTGPAPWDPRAPRIPENISQGAAWDMVVDSFDRIVPVLENQKITGAVEGVWGHVCNDYFTTRPLIDHFNSEYLGVNFDPSHDVLKGNLDTAWLIRQWGAQRIKHVHLKDAAGIQEAGKFVFPFLGEGYVDWMGFFGALAEQDYAGFLTVEFESFAYHKQILKKDSVEAARRCIEDVRVLLASSSKAASTGDES